MPRRKKKRGLAFDVTIDEKQLVTATNAIYVVSAALILSSLILYKSKNK